MNIYIALFFEVTQSVENNNNNYRYEMILYNNLPSIYLHTMVNVWYIVIKMRITTYSQSETSGTLQ